MGAVHKGTLPHGLKVGDKLHKDYELREGTTGDLFDAEDHAPPSKRVTYRGALLGRRLVKLGELSGPIDLAVIRTLHPDDFDHLVLAMNTLDDAGKEKPKS